MWKLTFWQRLSGLRLFIGHVADVSTLRRLAAKQGDVFPLFGGTAYCRHADVKALMAKEPEKLAGFCAPLEDASVYYSANYLPFLQKGANHAERRAHIVQAAMAARGNLAQLESLLAASVPPEAALARFLFRQFANLDLTADELSMFFYFRKWAGPLAILPTWLRRTLLRVQHRKLSRIRAHLMSRLQAACVPYADSYMDLLWFNCGTLGFYPEKAVETLRQDQTLRRAVAAEIDAPVAERRATRALVMEMMRLYPRVASVNYWDDNHVKIAVIPTANVDPERYELPMQIDLQRDYADALWFASPSPTRGCPGRELAPELMVCIVSHHVKAELS